MTGCSVVIATTAGELRRRPGPVAWVVLELAVSESCDGARVSARSFAAELDVRRRPPERCALTDVALMQRLERQGDEGRFTVSRYRLSVAAHVLSIIEARPARVAPVAVRAPGSQMSLLGSS